MLFPHYFITVYSEKAIKQIKIMLYTKSTVPVLASACPGLLVPVYVCLPVCVTQRKIM